jgi:hypothetical protein
VGGILHSVFNGNVLNTTDVVSTTAKGNRHHRRHHKLGGRPTHKSSSRNNSSLDDSLNRGTPSQNQTTEPSNPENPIQKPISANKTNWCLVGEYQENGVWKCPTATNACQQLFPSQSVCLNPNITTYKKIKRGNISPLFQQDNRRMNCSRSRESTTILYNYGCQENFFHVRNNTENNRIYEETSSLE